MSSNKFLCLSAFLLTVFILKTSEARPSLDPLQTKVIEAGGNPGKGRNIHVHHTQGPAHTHTHRVVAGGEGGANQNGGAVTHVHTFRTDGADNVHTVTTDGANNVNSVTMTGGPSDQQQNTVRTISLSQLPIPVVDTTGNKSPSNVKVQQCQKGLINGVASKAKDIINGGASQLGNLINRLTKNGKLLGPVGGIVNAVGQGVMTYSKMESVASIMESRYHLWT
uniref:Uncharacterized protein n=1 Tax=Latrodectus hesperus TaxID=256737 RepID=E7D1S6_LATHE|nr:hypothetical protein [Latrodectus hesperus]